jgi:hypothetical protein
VDTTGLSQPLIATTAAWQAQDLFRRVYGPPCPSLAKGDARHFATRSTPEEREAVSRASEQAERRALLSGQKSEVWVRGTKKEVSVIAHYDLDLGPDGLISPTLAAEVGAESAGRPAADLGLGMREEVEVEVLCSLPEGELRWWGTLEILPELKNADCDLVLGFRPLRKLRLIPLQVSDPVHPRPPRNSPRHR